ncbi:hypothetical protein HanRHA438_Chr10g0471821 [Helianthus annuus]|uniref:Uncharacterized protein n=1 Tax=Helianthus annuus TaxID=4232 RepID=A0A251TNJ5_HELAN|nr:hypothetical protein HanXRQr2_Chr10g0458981 [Helianthus annuus]KAJ0515114.1 hypothetical protein HanHA300_Chr10g0377111 [Helianthus annuus]KAJ0523505.1 hypothetical protein HanIR_Chr10g0494571 [Helianthus annuus]KAJ0531300.1 hypothetical protein HanHA89_Chr10g0399601 [Helianthus annuus]KAJ0698136.1 hypothetical protein HanLR1_Chr10g0376791 [Helianthus annuus]
MEPRNGGSRRRRGSNIAAVVKITGDTTLIPANLGFSIIIVSHYTIPTHNSVKQSSPPGTSHHHHHHELLRRTLKRQSALLPLKVGSV